MAESRRAKLARWARGDFTEADYQGIIGLLIFDQVIDVATGGKLSALKKKVGLKVVLPLITGGARLAGRAALGTTSLAGRSALGAALPVVTNPYVAGAALGYGALQTEPGQQLLEAASDRGRMDRIRFEQAITDVEQAVKKKVKKTKSKFNKAVSRGMAAAKRGTSYGKKGVINAPKKAFKAVTKIASKINKAKKTRGRLPPQPAGNAAKKIYKAILGVFK
jgi:hypothetical protein